MLDDGTFCSAWWRGFDAKITSETFEEQWPAVFHQMTEQTDGQLVDPEQRRPKCLLVID